MQARVDRIVAGLIANGGIQERNGQLKMGDHGAKRE